MDLKGIKLSEIIQTKTILCVITFMVSRKQSKGMNITKQKQTHRYRGKNQQLPMERGIEEGQSKGRGLKSTKYYV